MPTKTKRAVALEGILWIGDPHIASRRPGSRKDDFAKAILRKLREAFSIAKANRLQPIILGDLFHRPKEADLKVLTDLIELFSAHPVTPYCLAGNHDKQELSLTKGTSLQLLFSTGCLLPLSDVTLNLGGIDVPVRGVPHGEEVPAEVPTGTIVVTHHDFGFPDCQYPGCIPPPKVRGALYGINGHIHKASRPAFADMPWFNPGNIARVSRAEVENVPTVWSWRPGEVELTPHVLQHQPADKVFEEIVRIEGGDFVIAAESAFAKLIAAESTLDASQSDDASLLEGELDAALDASEATDYERIYIQRLYLACSDEASAEKP